MGNVSIYFDYYSSKFSPYDANQTFKSEVKEKEVKEEETSVKVCMKHICKIQFSETSGGVLNKLRDILNSPSGQNKMFHS